MKKELYLNNNKKISYLIKKSNRAKRVRLTIHQKKGIILTVPNGIANNIAENFLIAKMDWLLKKLDLFNQFKGPQVSKAEDKEKYFKNKQQARRFVIDRLKYFSEKYSFKFNRISIRNQKTRWGSCSEKGNLNFNYRLIYLTKEQADYIIVHELCHLRQLNHSRKFWSLVEEIVPNYLEIKKELRKINF